MYVHLDLLKKMSPNPDICGSQMQYTGKNALKNGECTQKVSPPTGQILVLNHALKITNIYVIIIYNK